MRNKNVDIVRSIALCTVLIYHIWVLSGSVSINNPIINPFITLGGEIGVTLFFIISGFGIYSALQRMEQTQGISFKSFLGKRMLRVAPEYYVSIVFALFMSNGAAYLAKEGIDDIVTHLTFTHNFFSATAGTINGVLWTMAVIVQFYVVAILLYKLMKKYHLFFALGTIGFTVLCKYLLFHRIGPAFQIADSFWLSRQTLFAVIDNFVLGMFVAHLLSIQKKNVSDAFWKQLAGIVVMIVGLYFVSVMGAKNGIHTDNVSGYVWHSLIAIFLSGALYFYGGMQCVHKNVLSKGLLWISKYEYGIYIVHLILIQFLLAYSPVVQYFNGKMFLAAWAILFVSSIGVGYLFSIMSNGLRQYMMKK